MTDVALEAGTAVAGTRSRIRSIVFWAATFGVLYELAAGSVWNLMTTDWVEAQLGHLGYPHYFAYVLGVAHVAAALAIAAPGFPLLKEWAYAGACFMWSGAVVSHWTLGDGVANWSVPLMFGVCAVLSWALRPADRRLAGTPRGTGSVGAVRLREWALPIGLLVALYAFAFLTLPAFEDITRQWAVDYGWIAE
jgi:hypothetical protein